MDYKFAYKLPDGDGGERTVQAESEEVAAIKVGIEICNFEDVSAEEVQIKLIGRGDMNKGTYYECEGCT